MPKYCSVVLIVVVDVLVSVIVVVIGLFVAALPIYRLWFKKASPTKDTEDTKERGLVA